MQTPIRHLTAILIVAAATATAADNAATPAAAWTAPADAAAVANPLAGNAAAATAGQQTFATMCAACHGATGAGDGAAAAALNPKPASLTSAAVVAQSDGSMFWKITTGRGMMTPWKDILTVEQRWQLVSYIRTLAAPAAPAK